MNESTITLHAAAEKQSTSDRVSISCNCKNKCQGRCRCLKNQVKCSVYCHADDHDCGNLSTLDTRTEIALLPRLGQQNTPSLPNNAPPVAKVNKTTTRKRKRVDEPMVVPSATLVDPDSMYIPCVYKYYMNKLTYQVIC